MMTVYVIVSRIGVPKQIAVLLLLTVIPYHFIALRRVFGGSRAMTFAKGLAVGLLYWIIALSAVMAITLSVLLTLSAARRRG